MSLSRFAKENPDKPAIIMGASGQRISYADLDRRSNQGAHFFRQLGLEPGDHIAFQIENSIFFFILLWSARRAGLIYTAISTHLKPDETAYIVQNCEAKAVIFSETYADEAAEVRDKTPGVLYWGMVNGCRQGFESWESSCAAQTGIPVDDEQRGAAMLYSSGTTGQPKGILPPWQPGDCVDELTADMAGLSAIFSFTVSSIYLSTAPLYHAGPLIFTTMLTLIGATIIVMEKFDAERSLALIEEHAITHSQWVPVMFTRMLQLPGGVRSRYDIASLKYAIHAAAPCPQEIKRQMIDWLGPIVYEYYSSTEGGAFISLSSQEWLAHPGSVGRALVGKVHILDDEGNELPPGSVGTIYFSDMRSRFQYYKDAAKTQKAYNRDGWMTVGDVGHLDEDGYLYLSDRKDFMIITGGVNVYPQEVENLLITHVKVADVAVFGIPDTGFGEAVKAVVQPRDWKDAGPDLERELIAYCRQRLSHVKSPKSIDFEAQLPRLETGKLYKKLLRARYL